MFKRRWSVELRGLERSAALAGGYDRFWFEIDALLETAARRKALRRHQDRYEVMAVTRVASDGWFRLGSSIGT